MCDTEYIMITSFKGGVGKSTVTANLSYILANFGYKVLAIDCDFNMRCLDLIMGVEDKVVYDICDVCTRDIPFSKAVIKDVRNENLLFCAAPYNFNGVIERGVFKSKIEQYAERENIDYVIFDTPGDMSSVVELVCSICSKALILATHQPSSIRAAERTSALLSEMGIDDRRLIINEFDASAVKSGKRPGIIEIIDRTFVRLIGVIPIDVKLSELQENGQLIDTLSGKNVYYAFENIALRLIGHEIPLFTNFSGMKKSVILK